MGRRLVLPLPKGEGRGEGKQPFIFHLRFDPYESAQPALVPLAGNNPAADVGRVAAIHARWFRGQTPFPAATARSKSGELSHPPGPATHPVPHPVSVVPETRAGIHPVQCSRTPPHKRNREYTARKNAAGEICKQKNAGREASSTRAFQPRYSACANCGRALFWLLETGSAWDYLSLLSPHPNPLPWGEGTAVAAVSQFESPSGKSSRMIVCAAANDSPSPQGRGPG